MKINLNKAWLVINKTVWEKGWLDLYNLYDQECFSDIEEALQNCEAGKQICISFDEAIRVATDSI